MFLKNNQGISSVVAMLIAVGVVAAGLSYWLLFSSQMNSQSDADLRHEDEAMMEDNMDGDAMEKEEGDAMMEDDHSDTMDQDSNSTPPVNNSNQSQNNPPAEDTMPVPGVYIDYSADALATAQAEGKKPVLFFWAAWCPFCKAANEEFNANSSRIPSNVVLLKTNYDTETQLKTRYGITYQHTFVQVDANGNQVTKWSGGGIDELISNVQ